MSFVSVRAYAARLVCMVLFASTAGAQGYREIARQTVTLKADTTQQGDTLMVMQTVQTQLRLVRTVAEPAQVFRYELRPSLSIVQAAFSNWVGGGVNAIAWSSGLNATTRYSENCWLWETRLYTEFGQTLVDGVFRKTNDIIDFSTVVRYDLGSSLQPQFSASLRTQFAEGFDFSQPAAPRISAFFDPAYSVQSLGISYGTSDTLRASIGLAAREIFTNQFPTFADDPKTPELERVNIRAGVEFYAVWLVEFFKGATFRTRTQLFAPFARLGALEVNQKFTLFFNINNLLDTRLGVVLLYQENISRQLQVQQTLDLTVSFKISNQ